MAQLEGPRIKMTSPAAWQMRHEESPKREPLILRDDMLLVFRLRHPKHPCVMFGVKLSMFPMVPKRDATPVDNPRCS